MSETLYHYLVHVCGAEHVRRDEPLARWTTFRVGGPAQFLVHVTSKQRLARLLNALNYLDYPYFILGLGANVLASDQGFAGVVIKLDFREIYHNDIFLYADAGARLGVVGNYARDHGLAGLEWATGIPATMGGAVYMNCGAFGHSMQDCVVMVDVIDQGVVKTLTVNQLNYGYRHSVFMEKDYVILGAYLRLTPGDPATIGAQMRAIIAKRAHHPKLPSAGSTFKRPYDGFYVGKTIQELGLAGYQIGGAQVSPEHAGFIVNTGGATAGDIYQLITHVQDTVRRATGVTIQPEVIFLGKI